MLTTASNNQQSNALLTAKILPLRNLLSEVFSHTILGVVAPFRVSHGCLNQLQLHVSLPYNCTALVTLSYHRSWFYWKNNCFSMVYVRQNFCISFFKWQKSNSNANLQCFVTYDLKLLLKSLPTCMLFSQGSLLRSTDMIATESNCRGHTKRSDIAVPDATSLSLQSVQTFLPLLFY